MSVKQEGVPDPLGLAFELGGAEAGLGRGDMGAPLDGEVESQLRSMMTLYRNAEEATYSAKIMDYLGSLRQLAEVLEAVQGRKQVILFSSGFQQTSLMGVTGVEAMSNNVAVAEGRIWEVRPDGFRRFVLNVTPADISPGDYTLQVTLGDPRTGAVSRAGQSVRVH